MRPADPVDYCFFLRPPLLVPVWTLFLLGYGTAGTFWPSDPALWAGLLAMTAVFGGAFVLNQCFDLKSDERNQKCLFLTSGLIGRKAAFRYYAALNLLALGCVYLAPRSGAFVVLVMILGVIYSAPPWRWKDRPFLALAVNAFAHGYLAYLSGSAAAGPLNFDSSVAALPYVCGVSAVYLLTTIPDREGDREEGKHTLAVIWGPERTARWAMGWFLAALLLATYEVDLLFLLAVLPAAIPLVQAGRGRFDKIRAAVTWPVLGLSVAAALLQPWYALLLVAGYWATRSYYRRRWGRTYP